MFRSLAAVTVLTGFALTYLHIGMADDPVKLANVSAPAPNRPEDPVVKAFSLDPAANFLDSASLQWQKQRRCMTCHTNYAYW